MILQAFLIKHQRNAVLREIRGITRVARSHRHVTILCTSNFLVHFWGEDAQVRGFEPQYQIRRHHRTCPRSGLYDVRVTRFSTLLRSARYVQPPSCEKRHHLSFLLFQRQVRGQLRKILHGEEFAIPTHCGNADGGHAGIEDIFAVTGRIHPPRVDALRVRADGDVLSDVTEMRSGSGEAFLNRGLTRELMLEGIHIAHKERVLACGLEESFVPLKFGKFLCGALVVEKFEKFALGGVALESLRWRIKSGKEK